ncbi:autophagy protein 13, partial [Rhizophlyctis rosea]
MQPYHRPTHSSPSTSPRQHDLPSFSPSYATPPSSYPSHIRSAAASVASLSSVGSAAGGSRSKAEQIIQQFYSKAAQIIVQARWTPPNSGGDGGGDGVSAGGGVKVAKKRNAWFNLETEDPTPLRDDLKPWKLAALNTTTQPPPLIIDIYLDISNLDPASQTLILQDGVSQLRQRITQDELKGFERDGTRVVKRTILLETWQLTLSHPIPTQPLDPPLVYKRSAAFFRSLYSYVRLLPAHRLFRKLRDREGGALKIGYRLSSSRMMRVDEAGLDQLHSSGDMRTGISEWGFGNVDTSHGVFNLHVTYRLSCDFSTDTSSTSLLNRFTDMDENYFSPKSLDRQTSSTSDSYFARDPRRS